MCAHCGTVVFTGLQCTECRTVCHKACVEKARARALRGVSLAECTDPVDAANKTRPLQPTSG